MKKFLFLSIIGLLFLSCKEKNVYRSPRPDFRFSSKSYNVDEFSTEYQMEIALLIKDENECCRKVDALLKQGADPNVKAGQLKWVDTNPLWNVCSNKVLTRLLISYGADVKKRPYIAKCISGKIAITQEQYLNWKNEGYAAVKLEESILESVKVLLEYGADPNLKWIGGEKILIPATDWNYLRYFKKHGKSPINNAIKYNAIKLAALLLENGAKLDEDSLILAEQTTEKTGSSEMEELIKQYWKKNLK